MPRISVNRLNDIYIKEDEEDRYQVQAAAHLPAIDIDRDAIAVSNLHFSYNGPLSPAGI